MIKECEVIYRNEKVSVVKFDNKKIQIPNSDLIGRNVYIRFDKGTYTVVSKNEFEKENIKEAISLFFTIKNRGVIIDSKIKFDKEYCCTYPLEMLFLKESGIPYTFVKKNEDGITVWKYRKTYRLFDILKNFYKNQ